MLAPVCTSKKMDKNGNAERNRIRRYARAQLQANPYALAHAHKLIVSVSLAFDPMCVRFTIEF